MASFTKSAHFDGSLSDSGKIAQVPGAAFDAKDIR
jgi:hypothetical protein